MNVIRNLMPALVLVALAVMPGTADATMLFQDDFSGSAGSALNGTTPDVTQAGAAWVADVGYMADGSASDGPRRAYLALGNLINANRGQPDAIYTLTARVNVNPSHTDESLWEGIGFWYVAAPATNFASSPAEGVAYMIRRGSSAIKAFRGTGTTNPTDGTVSPHLIDGTLDLRVVLDLSAWNGSTQFGTVSHYAKLASDPDYVLIASGALNSTNSSFLTVGIGGGAIAADFSNFELSKLSSSTGDDADDDGLTDAQEAVLGLNPGVSDAALIAAIRNNPEFFGLHDAAGMLALGGGGVMLPQTGGDPVNLTLEVQYSADLTRWYGLQTYNRDVELPVGKNFLRLRIETTP